MHVSVINLKGQVLERIRLPKEMFKEIREDLILRAFLATMSKRRQPYGADVLAGKRTSAHYHGRRRYRWTMMLREMARMPRIHAYGPPHLMWEARLVPQARKGRRAHPPKVEKIWVERINKKERKKAIRSAIAASLLKEYVERRGHKIKELKFFPVVVDDEIQKIKKTKDLAKFLEEIGLKKELERVKRKKIRAGRGKMRGRKYRRKIGILFVVTKDEGISKAVKNLPGCHVCRVENLSVEHLAPGANPGRLTIWSRSALSKLRKAWCGK